MEYRSTLRVASVLFFAVFLLFKKKIIDISVFTTPAG
jgi:hypothetical protein